MSDMTHEKWCRLTPAQKEAIRDNSKLTPQLVGKEGYRVEVVGMNGTRRRFIVGKSTGWVPCHLEMRNRASRAGGPAAKEYRSVRTIEKVW